LSDFVVRRIGNAGVEEIDLEVCGEFAEFGKDL